MLINLSFHLMNEEQQHFATLQVHVMEKKVLEPVIEIDADAA